MFKIIFGILVFVILMYVACKDNNKDVAAWRRGEYGKAILYYAWYVLKVFIFFFFSPFLLFFLFFRD